MASFVNRPNTAYSSISRRCTAQRRQLVAAGELELAQHGRDVRLDGLRRDAELGGDLLVHVSARDVLEHLALARRQQVQLRVDLRGRDLAGEGVEHEAGQAR